MVPRAGLIRGDGAVTDIGTVEHALPVYLSHYLIGARLRGTHTGAECADTQHSAAGGDHLIILERGAGMKDLGIGCIVLR